jgi:HAD superfamily hydrolase (TIGR01509 family)
MPLVTSFAAIDTLFLDAGGVLVHPSWDRVGAALAEAGVAVDPARLAAADPHAKHALDAAMGTGPTDDRRRGWLYFDLVLERAGIAASEATNAALASLRAYHDEHNLWERVDDGVVPALTAFRARGLRLVVVSNANGRLRHLFDRLDLTRWFDALIDSHEWGVEKPDPRLFRLALTASGAAAERTVHVGDLYGVDVVGARSAGLAGAILVDSAGLYTEADCPRVARLAEVGGWLDREGGNG